MHVCVYTISLLIIARALQWIRTLAERMSSTQYLLFEVRGEVAVELGCINPGRGWGSAVVAIGDAE